MNRADLIRQLMSTELEDHKRLTRAQARAAVDEFFGAITEGLKEGKVVRLPIGNFAVREHDSKPRRGWYLGRVRVPYRKRNYVDFHQDEKALESFDGDSSPTRGARGATKQKKERAQKLSVSERRNLVLIGAKAGKSQRLIAQELGVSAPTVARDMGILGIKTHKKPTATRKKKAATWKPKSPRISAKQSAENRRWKPPRRVTPSTNKKAHQNDPPPSRFKPKPRLQTAAERRQEMLQLVKSWLKGVSFQHLRAAKVIDKTRNLLNSRPVSNLKRPIPVLSAAQLRDQTQPTEKDWARKPGTLWTEDACAVWLARWLSAWAPGDDDLQQDVLKEARQAVAKPHEHL